MWLKTGTFSAISVPEYRKLLFSATVFSVAQWSERLAIGWLFIYQTESVFLTGMSFAVRQIPMMLLAPFAGTVSDRIPIRRILFSVGIAQAFFAILMAFAVMHGDTNVLIMFAIILMSGVGFAFLQPSTQKSFMDVVPNDARMNAISTGSVAMRATAVVTAFGSTLLFDKIGGSATLFFVTAIYLIASVNCFFLLKNIMPTHMTKKTGLFFSEVGRGMHVLFSNSLLRTLLLLAFVIEIFGFAYQAILPAVAQEVLKLNVTGYGSLSSIAAFGSLLGTIFLMNLADFKHKGKLLIVVTVLYGIFIATFSLGGIYVLAGILLLGVGACSAVFDSLQWTLLQLNVPEDMRGRAIGGWTFVIGFGWIGHILIGAAAEFLGISQALFLAGSCVSISGLLLFLFLRRLRTV